MTNQTDDRGRRLEDLYDACMKLPADRRDEFIASQTAGDPDLARQLRLMIQLQDPPGVSLFGTRSQSGAASPYDLVSGTEFGKCRILDPIGAGGMGAVYYAVDLQNHDRPVALKVMQPTMLKPDDRNRFPTETSALSRLIHPNIARLYFRGIETWNGTERPFLVMEYVDGKTLDQFLDHNQLSIRQILELLRKIAGAVHYGHLKGVFHRDLKPSNILVAPDGEPKIIDYGVSFTASAASAPGGESPSHNNAGTVAYMAPEVASGAAYVPDSTTDVYSLGIIAFEAFAKRRPGVQLPSGDVQLLDAALTSSEIRQKISTCQRERLRRVNRRFAFDLECVVAKALRLDVEDRFGDASEFADDLQRLIDLQPIKELQKSRLYTTNLFFSRNRLAVTAVLAAFTVIVAAAVRFRVDESRVQTALKREAVLRNQAQQQRDQIQRQYAAGHFREAQLAEQRGNWSVAADEYRAAEEAGFPEPLSLAVGELRAMGRLDRSSDAAALITRIHSTRPDIARSPQFQVVEGFTSWSFKPGESLRTIQQALVHADQLAPPDRAFAEALTTDDIRVASAKLRETVEGNLFNRDAWALLGLSDLVMGDARLCERDAGVLQRLYPADETGDVLAAVAAAFEGRRAESNAYLSASAKIPPQLKATVAEILSFVSQTHSFDDARTAPGFTTPFGIPNTVVSVVLEGGSHAVPEPIAFKRLTNSITPAKVVRSMLNADVMWERIAAFPNGEGELATGWLAMKRRDYTSAVQHLQAVQTTPCLIDCRRIAAIALMYAHARERIYHHVQPNADGTLIIKKDVDQLISSGGLYPDKFEEEKNALSIPIGYSLYPQVRTLALLWMSHAPDDPLAMYYLAIADCKLNDSDSALFFYKQAIAKNLAGDEKTDAQEQIRKLTSPAATKPAAMPQ